MNNSTEIPSLKCKIEAEDFKTLLNKKKVFYSVIEKSYLKSLHKRKLLTEL